MKRLQYTVKEKELKGMGYIFQMLYTDRKSYRLEIEKYHCVIWLWCIGKRIHVNDWYDHTYDIVEFYKANKDDSNYIKKDYIIIALNRNTGNIIVDNRWEEFEELTASKNSKGVKDLLEKYTDVSQIYLYKEKMDKVVIALEKLNPITHQVYAE